MVDEVELRLFAEVSFLIGLTISATNYTIVLPHYVRSH